MRLQKNSIRNGKHVDSKEVKRKEEYKTNRKRDFWRAALEFYNRTNLEHLTLFNKKIVYNLNCRNSRNSSKTHSLSNYQEYTGEIINIASVGNSYINNDNLSNEKADYVCNYNEKDNTSVAFKTDSYLFFRCLTFFVLDFFDYLIKRLCNKIPYSNSYQQQQRCNHDIRESTSPHGSNIIVNKLKGKPSQH